MGRCIFLHLIIFNRHQKVNEAGAFQISILIKALKPIGASVSALYYMDRTLLQIEPKIRVIPEKKLIGKRLTMSLANNKTSELWRSFLPKLKEVQKKVSKERYSVHLYSQSYFDSFMPGNEFEKWAAVEVFDFNNVPEEMEMFTIAQGLYAVFPYKGISTDNTLFEYIFRTWLPSSEYLLDHRPHFEVLGENYRNSDPNSEEDIYIPIRLKKKLAPGIGFPFV